MAREKSAAVPLEERVRRAAESYLERQGHVNALEMFCGINLLQWAHVERWQQGRLEYLGEEILGKPEKIRAALTLFRQWGEEKNLPSGEAEYWRQTRNGPVALRVWPLHEADLAFRLQYEAADLPPREKQKLAAVPDPVVFEVLRESKCAECEKEIEPGGMLTLEAEKALCLKCARLDDLEFLPSGDAMVTRRAKKYSARSAVVVRFSRSRGRYERQGLLVERAALERAERERREAQGSR
ncbi:MAG: hypothetical protein SFV54_26855 [Bryobacteraceae bacterium]|nr:hypothetical protein [Bryobacteraceae bacterium]